MMQSPLQQLLFPLLLITATTLAQSASDYGPTPPSGGSLLFIDTRKLRVSHSISMGMSGSSAYSGLRSQSLYSTSFLYQFSPPITAVVSVALPLYNNYNDNLNPSQKNLSSMEYFKNMPLDAALQWRPQENLLLEMRYIRESETNSPFDPMGFYSPYRSPFPSSNMKQP